jgi:tetratricopeptide (TPR) repeat protein
MSGPTFPSLWQRFRWYWASRDWRVLGMGGPALLAGLAVLWLGWLCFRTDTSELQARYLENGKAAFARKDYQRALACYERLASLTEDRPEVSYCLALTAEQLGHADRAVRLMSELAPQDRKGYAPAHFWWARQLLLAVEPSEQARSAAEVHLVRALDGDLPDRATGQGLLGQLYLARGRLEEAELLLSKAVQSRPHLRLWLARVYARRKDLSRARQEAHLAVRFFRARAKADLDDHLARLTWADGVSFLEDYPTAVAILQEGLSATQADIYRSALARVHLAWYEARKEAGAAAGELLELLRKGLSYEPSNRDLLNRLLTWLKGPASQADEARAVLRRLLAAGKATAYAHFALSVDAWQRGDARAARLHLERAHQTDPAIPLVANNLAWLLAQPPRPDLPRALRLANLALEQQPANSAFRDTRGRIYLKMRRWKEALADLEAALDNSSGSPALHQALAEAYEKLGNAPLAAEHRRLARSTPAGPGVARP